MSLNSYSVSFCVDDFQCSRCQKMKKGRRWSFMTTPKQYVCDSCIKNKYEAEEYLKKLTKVEEYLEKLTTVDLDDSDYDVSELILCENEGCIGVEREENIQECVNCGAKLCRICNDFYENMCQCCDEKRQN